MSLAKGLHQAWLNNGDFDMRSRVSEYTSFRQGVYPNRALEGNSAPDSVPYSVYPPYALPMFTVFFEPGGKLQGRILIEILSLASLVVIGIYGFRELNFAGPALAAEPCRVPRACQTYLRWSHRCLIPCPKLPRKTAFFERLTGLAGLGFKHVFDNFDAACNQSP